MSYCNGSSGSISVVVVVNASSGSSSSSSSSSSNSGNSDSSGSGSSNSSSITSRIRNIVYCIIQNPITINNARMSLSTFINIAKSNKKKTSDDGWWMVNKIVQSLLAIFFSRFTRLKAEKESSPEVGSSRNRS